MREDEEPTSTARGTRTMKQCSFDTRSEGAPWLLSWRDVFLSEVEEESSKMNAALECKGVNSSSTRNPMACYTDRKPELRILGGSV